MKKYKILETIMLGFITRQDQYDSFFKPEDGYVLESDGSTIWAVKGEERHESITVAHAIGIWLGNGSIEELS
jgi:hypothetical protein